MGDVGVTWHGNVATVGGATASLAFLLGFLSWSYHLHASSRVDISVRREYSVALRSGFIYLAIALPLLINEITRLLPDEFVRVYTGLPFWYAFVVATSLGGFIHVAVDCVLGTAIAVLAAMILNYLMPGGAGPLGQDPDFSRGAWLPGGYSPVACWILTVLFVYSFMVSGFDTDVKYYALGTFSQIIVTFMNPAQNADSFRGVIWDWEFHFQWRSTVMCQVYRILAAVILSMVTIPVVPCFRESRDFWRSRAQVTKGLAELAADTIGCLEHLLGHFRCERATAQELESSYLYIKQLGSRRSALEKTLKEAAWECWAPGRRARLRGLQRFSTLLRGLRQVLRIELDHLRGQGGAPIQRRAGEVSPHLENFVSLLKDALAILAEPRVVWKGLDQESRQQVVIGMENADAALLNALEKLQDGGAALSMELAFVDSLRTCQTLVDEFLKEVWPESHQRTWCKCRPSSLLQYLPSRKRHLAALRNSASWLLAFSWSLYVRDYDPSCVVGVSFIFSSSLGSLFDRNINRIVGVGMGLVVGNVPAIVMLHTGDKSLDPTDVTYYTLFSYFVIMLIMWTTAMYGYLATGAKWRYACLLWAGYGGCQMLVHLSPSRPNREYTQLFLSMMDDFAGCIIVFIVDILFARLFSGFTSEHVATLVPSCLDDIASIVDEGLQPTDGNHTFIVHAWEEHLKSLQMHIAESRFWDEEVKKEDPAWSMMCVPRYKEYMIHAILENCDAAYVAAYSIHASIARGALSKEAERKVPGINSQVGLLADLGAHSRSYARVVRAALSENILPTGSLIIEHREIDMGINLRRPELHEFARTSSGDHVCEIAAAQTLCAGIRAMCLALRGVEALVRQHMNWASEDWDASEQLRRRRATSTSPAFTPSSAPVVLSLRNELLCDSPCSGTPARQLRLVSDDSLRGRRDSDSGSN